MKTCPYCGEENRDQNEVCASCGGYLSDSGKIVEYQYKLPTYGSNSRDSYTKKIAYYPNGGLIFWSIITCLLCTFFGVFALVNAASINNCVSPTVQEHRITVSRTCNTIGTILGVILLILYISTAAYR